MPDNNGSGIKRKITVVELEQQPNKDKTNAKEYKTVIKNAMEVKSGEKMKELQQGVNCIKLQLDGQFVDKTNKKDAGISK